MALDFSRFDAFWRNPERYRIVYECNIVPAQTSYALQRGTAFHLIREWHHAGLSQLEIDQKLLQQPELTDPKARGMAVKMWREWQVKYNPHGPRALAVEQEFKFNIPGSPHFMCGRLDEMIEVNGVVWVGETKTANAKTTLVRLKERWRNDKQAGFVLLGARSLGYEPHGVLIRTILETTPPKIWELTTTRTDRQLELLQLEVHQTCELIEFMRANFGIDQPWPHLTGQWPCSAPGRCEQEAICQRTKEAWGDLSGCGFTERREHLKILQ